MKVLGELQVVTGAQSPIAKFIKGRVENLTAGLLERNVASKVRESLGANDIVLPTAEDFEDVVHSLVGVRIGFAEMKSLNRLLLTLSLSCNLHKEMTAFALVGRAVIDA